MTLDGKSRSHLRRGARRQARAALLVLPYAASLRDLERFEEAKALLRRPIIVARRFLGEDNQITLLMRSIYAQALYKDPAATLDDLREAVTTVEAVERIARRVCGGAHPLTKDCELSLQDARAALRAIDMPPQPRA